MGTEVLYPQDLLARRLILAPAGFFPRRKPHRQSLSNGFLRHDGGNVDCVGSNSASARPCRKVEQSRKRRDASPKSPPAELTGQVTILKRGQSLDARASRSLNREKGVLGAVAVLSSDRCSDLIVFGTERLGPEPAMMSAQIRIAATDVYAGPAFGASPSPSALPLPTFSMKREGTAASTAVDEGLVDHSATEDLRRLLRLEL